MMKSIIFHHEHKPILQQISVLSITMDMALIQDHSLVPKLGLSWPSSKSDSSILSTRQKQTSLAINMFALVGARFLSVLIITSAAYSLRAESLRADHDSDL